MRLNEVVYSNALPIEGYGPGFFRIGGEAHQAPLAVLPEAGVTAWGGTDDTKPLLDALNSIDVLLVGTGPEIAHLPEPFRTALEEAGLGVEVMASPQACRTYNVLLGEGRRVGLALLPV
ncbi:hypothetical protein GQ651_04040 [Alphaproteobacteria bacterium GH1-50]|uniref:Mth938-like domain-containing protein n=1 Tax=Kangsaoukella pontilimi TaxID=2691042 RepID=A0A7C9MCC5_9RHOB|nr:Mth938-like domain-containing protein [Kangsaoukella pontilimi]MXQ07012.1 hypothetical protein [Kangsaoukella pontilimi]